MYLLQTVGTNTTRRWSWGAGGCALSPLRNQTCLVSVTNLTFSSDTQVQGIYLIYDDSSWIRRQLQVGRRCGAVTWQHGLELVLLVGRLCQRAACELFKRCCWWVLPVICHLVRDLPLSLRTSLSPSHSIRELFLHIGRRLQGSHVAM